MLVSVPGLSASIRPTMNEITSRPMTQAPTRTAATGLNSASVREAGLVLFCVKTRDTDEGARALAPLLRPEAVVVSLQNGVDNVPRLREAGVDALAAVVYVATSMPAPGHLLHAGRGDLVIGEYCGRAATGSEGAAASASTSSRASTSRFPRATSWR